MRGRLFFVGFEKDGMESEVLEQSDVQPEDVDLQSANEQPEDTNVAVEQTDAVDERVEYLKGLSADEILELHPALKKRIANITGNLAQKQAKELLAKELPGVTASVRNQVLAEMQHAAEFDRLEEMSRVDQFSFANEMRNPEKAAIWLAGRQMPLTASNANERSPEQVKWESSVMQIKMGRLSKEGQASFAKKSYDMTPTGRAAFEAEADALWLEEQVEHALSTRTKAADKRATAERIDALADDAGDTPDAGVPQASRGGLMTMAQYDRLPAHQAIAFRRNNPDAYDRMINRAYPRT